MIVLDSSFLIAGLLPEPRTAFVRPVLTATVGVQHAPLLLLSEVTHVQSRRERRREISPHEANAALVNLHSQSIEYDASHDPATGLRTFSLARAHGLSGYDAEYLELAIRLGAELGTLDGELAAAGQRSGLMVHHA